MSRPPDQHRYIDQQYESASDVIDFARPRSLAANRDGYSVYAQAGFPGYTAPLNAQIPQQPISMAYPQYQQVPAQTIGTGYASYAPPMISAPYPTPLETEAAVQERIKANIDAIMETQRTAMLNTRVESIANKVNALAQKIENNESSHVRSLSASVERLTKNISSPLPEPESVDQIKSLSEKVERLSRSLEQRSAHSLSSGAESDISRRLHRLAAESSGRPSENIPDW